MLGFVIFETFYPLVCFYDITLDEIWIQIVCQSLLSFTVFGIVQFMIVL